MKRLRVKPVMVTGYPQRVKAMSWRGWGDIQTFDAAQEERKRVEAELADLAARASFSLEIQPLVEIQTASQALYQVGPELNDADVVLVYGVQSGKDTYEALASFAKDMIVFVRHESGPFYGFYETAHPLFLRKRQDVPRQPGFSYKDVVVDDYNELLWRLEALYGLHNTRGSRVVCLGSYAGWQGEYREAYLARRKWGMDIRLVSYEDLGNRLEAAFADGAVTQRAADQAEEYIQSHQAVVATDREFIDRAFVVYKVFKDLLTEHGAENFTIGECMGTMIQVGKTTACLPLSLLNDEGLVASCEAIFDTVPVMTLLRYVSGRPGFLNDPTFPHKGVITLGHCTAPTKLDGVQSEPVELVTHYESDYGVAPKVLFTPGTEATIVVPDFDAERWHGIRARVIKPTRFDACRSQVDVELMGDWERLNAEMTGFHWVMTYGDWSKHLDYVLPRVGIEYVQL